MYKCVADLLAQVSALTDEESAARAACRHCTAICSYMGASLLGRTYGPIPIVQVRVFAAAAAVSQRGGSDGGSSGNLQV